MKLYEAKNILKKNGFLMDEEFLSNQEVAGGEWSNDGKWIDHYRTEMDADAVGDYVSNDSSLNDCLEYARLKTRAFTNYIEVTWADIGNYIVHDINDYDLSRYKKFSNKTHKTDKGITFEVDASRVLDILYTIIDTNAKMFEIAMKTIFSNKISAAEKLSVVPQAIKSVHNICKYCKDKETASQDLLAVCRKTKHNKNIILRLDHHDISFTIIFEDYLKSNKIDIKQIKQDINELLEDISKSLYEFAKEIINRYFGEYVDFIEETITSILHKIAAALKLEMMAENYNIEKAKTYLMKRGYILLKENINDEYTLRNEIYKKYHPILNKTTNDMNIYLDKNTLIIITLNDNEYAVKEFVNDGTRLKEKLSMNFNTTSELKAFLIDNYGMELSKE